MIRSRQVWEKLLIGEVHVRSIPVGCLRRRAWVVTTENLLIPLSLMKANLGFPRLENGLLSLENAILPPYVVPKISVPVLFVEQVVIPLSQLLCLFHLFCDMRSLSHYLLGLRRTLKMR